MHRPTDRAPALAMAAVALVTVLITALITATPAAAISYVHYVALGDSYSAGLGAGGETGSCLRSDNAYSVLWAAKHRPATFDFVACSGATTDDLKAHQLDSLNFATTLVSLSIGGNDIGFSSIMKACALQGPIACGNAVASAKATATTKLPALLDSTYDAISARAPGAEVVVLDYPLFYDPNAVLCVGLLQTSRVLLDEGIKVLDDVIEKAAARHHFVFADVRGSFGGHQICDSTAWLHALDYLDVTHSYHPTPAGQASGYLPAFDAAV